MARSFSATAASETASTLPSVNRPCASRTL